MNAEPALFKHFSTITSLHLVFDLLNKVAIDWVNSLRGGPKQGLKEGPTSGGGGDEAFIGHAVEDVGLAALGGSVVAERGVKAGSWRQTSQERNFGQVEVAG